MLLLPLTSAKARTSLSLAAALLLCGTGLSAQTKPAKTTTPAKPAATAAKPAATAAAKPAAGTAAAHPTAGGATTAGATAAHTGPTTAGATTAHTGPTTSNPGHGPTTAGGPTTANSTHGPTTTAAGRSSAAATTTAGARPSTAVAPVGARTAGRPGAVAGVDHGPLAHPAPRNQIERSNAAGVARMRPDGRAADIHNARMGMDVHHNLVGGRRIEAVRPDGRRFVSERGRPGYIGRPYAFHGHEFEHRAYYYHGRVYNRYYGAYRYHGYDMHVYTPGRYYPAAYYGWAYNPWGAPVRYGWAYRNDPWYGYYGAYYTPYPVYSSPSLWLTDYMLSQTLAAAYQARQEAGAEAQAQAAYAGPPLSPETKQFIANEVQNDIALENAQAATNQQQGVPDSRPSSVARLMEDGKAHAFVAGREVDVTDASGQECAITDGDVVQLNTPPGPQDTTAAVVVLASKGGKECQRGAQVAIGIDELQEMDNHLREQVDAGLQELAAQQGKNGLPAAPASAMAPPSDSLVSQGAPPADPAGAQELAQQDSQAQQAEKEVLSASGSPGASPAQPAGNEDLFKPQ